MDENQLVLYDNFNRELLTPINFLNAAYSNDEGQTLQRILNVEKKTNFASQLDAYKINLDTGDFLLIDRRDLLEPDWKMLDMLNHNREISDLTSGGKKRKSKKRSSKKRKRKSKKSKSKKRRSKKRR